MVFFSHSPNKVISEREFDKIKTNLHGEHNWTKDQIGKFDSIFQAHMSEEGMHKGIDRKEADKTLDWMSKNHHSHGLSDHHIETIRHEFDKHLND